MDSPVDFDPDDAPDDAVEDINLRTSARTPIGEFEEALSVEEQVPINLVVEYESETGLVNEAALAFQFFDTNGEPLSNPDWPAVSKSIGEYKYLKSCEAGGRAVDVVSLVPPVGSTDLYIRGFQWDDSGRTNLVGRLEVARSEGGVSITETELGKPLPNKSSVFRAHYELSDNSSALEISMTIEPGEVVGTSPLQVVFRDREGNEMAGCGDLPQNPRFGSFIALEPSAVGAKRLTAQIEVPNGAQELELRGVEWGAKAVTIIGPVEIDPLPTAKSELNAFLGKQHLYRGILVIDTTAPAMGHDTLALRPNNLSRAYAELGYGVVFFPFGTLQGEENRVASNIVQFDRGDFDDVMTALLDATPSVPKIYICSSFPSLQACTKAERLKAAGWRIVYECRDDMEEFNRVGYSKWYHPQLERKMLEIADTVVSVSKALDEKLSSIVPYMPPHHVVPNGVNKRILENGAGLRTQTIAELRAESRKVGYVGHLTESWFDWPLLTEAAKNLPSIEFEIVGHGMPIGVELPANVTYLGPKNHDELVEIVRDWKAGLIPFKNLPLTRSVDPNKIYEYYAWGLRCVTAPMGMVDEYPSTWVYRTISEFEDAVDTVIEQPMTGEELEALNTFVERCTWHHRAVQMTELAKF